LLTLGTCLHEAVLPEHAEVARDRRAADGELGGDLARVPLALRKQFDDLPAGGIRQSFQRVHG
jgi:hypothetical protein